MVRNPPPNHSTIVPSKKHVTAANASIPSQHIFSFARNPYEVPNGYANDAPDLTKPPSKKQKLAGTQSKTKANTQQNWHIPHIQYPPQRPENRAVLETGSTSTTPSRPSNTVNHGARSLTAASVALRTAAKSSRSTQDDRNKASVVEDESFEVEHTTAASVQPLQSPTQTDDSPTRVVPLIKSEPCSLKFILDERQFPKQQQWPQPKPLPKRSGVKVEDIVCEPDSPAPAPGQHLSLEKHADRIAAMIAEKRKANESNMMRERLLQKQLQHKRSTKPVVDQVRAPSPNNQVRSRSEKSREQHVVEKGKTTEPTNPVSSSPEASTLVAQASNSTRQQKPGQSADPSQPQDITRNWIKDRQSLQIRDGEQNQTTRPPPRSQLQQAQAVPTSVQPPDRISKLTPSTLTAQSQQPQIVRNADRAPARTFGTQHRGLESQPSPTGFTMIGVSAGIPPTTNTTSRQRTYMTQQQWLPTVPTTTIRGTNPESGPSPPIISHFTRNTREYPTQQSLVDSTSSAVQPSFYNVNPGVWYGAESSPETRSRPAAHSRPSSLTPESLSGTSQIPPRFHQPPVLASNMNMFNGNARESVASGSGAGAIGSTRKNMFRSGNTPGSSGRESPR